MLRLLTGVKNKVFIHTYFFKMDKAYLRHSKDVFDLSLHFSHPESKVDRRFNFSRKLDEPVSSFLSRVIANVEKAIMKKKKKKKENTTESTGEENLVKACLIHNDAIVENDTLCKDVFTNEDDSVILRLMNKDYAVVINAPYIDGIALPNSILANFPVYPNKFDAVYTDKKLCEYTWYTSKNKDLWEKVGTGYTYIASNGDIGSYIKLICIPKNKNKVGPIVEIISDVTVDASPGECPFESRHAFTTEKCSEDEFRVVSYNILADLYCDSDFSRTVLYPYCPPYALSIDYRKQLIIKEILGYNADIICLQEVDKKIYTHDLDPVLSSQNYDSDFVLKGGQVAEGLACFYDSSRFKFLERSWMILAEELGSNAILAYIWEKICRNEKLKERILNRTTALQTVTLENILTGNIVLVANTHLYFHPDSDHIRLLQGYINIRYLQDVYQKLKEKYKTKNISMIFCGDFNSVPECGIYQLYTKGTVPSDCVDFKSNEEESIIGMDLHQTFKLASACGTPKYTNFTAGFQDCLDYIYYDKSKLSVAQVVPQPTNEELVENTALPSIVFPSDHISLVADLRFL